MNTSKEILTPDWKTILDAATENSQREISRTLTLLGISHLQNINVEDAKAVKKDLAAKTSDDSIFQLLDFLINTF